MASELITIQAGFTQYRVTVSVVSQYEEAAQMQIISLLVTQ